jgi:hypothetical protein
MANNEPVAPRTKERVPISLHEANITKHVLRGRDGEVIADDPANKILMSAAEKYAAGRARMGELANAINKILDDSTMPEGQRVARAHALKERFVASGTADVVDAALDELEKGIAQSRADTWFAPVVRDARSLQLERDAAAFIRSLPETKRPDFIRRAINANDEITIAAVFCQGPSYLVGLDPDSREAMRNLYRLRAHPQNVEAESRMSKALETARIGANSGAKWLTELIDKSPANRRLIDAQEAVNVVEASIRNTGSK